MTENDASDSGRLAFTDRGPSAPAVAILALAVLVVTAGCVGILGDEDDQEPPLDSIPDGVDGVVHVKSSILQDDSTEELMDGVIDMTANQTAGVDEDDPQSWDEVLTELENDTAIDVEEFHSATMFVKTENLTAGGTELGPGMNATEAEQAARADSQATQYGGVIIQSDWTWEELTDATENTTDAAEFEEQSYNGVTVYVSDSERGAEMWVGDMGDGTFALGTETAVKDVIDTREGDSDPFSGQLRSAYENTTDGYITAAFTVTDEQMDAVGDAASEEAGMGLMLVPDVQVLTMSYYTDDGEMTLDTQMTLESTEEARQIESVLEPILEPETVSEDPDPGESPIEWATASTTLEQDGENVTITVAVTPDELLTLLEETDPGSLGSLPGGAGVTG